MLETIKNNREIFDKLYRARNDADSFRNVLTKMSRIETSALAEVALNCLYGAICFSHGKCRRLQAIKPVLKSLSAMGIGPATRKKICLLHVDEIAAFLEIVYKNLQTLIWNPPPLRKMVSK